MELITSPGYLLIERLADCHLKAQFYWLDLKVIKTVLL